ncbi:MAG TPA: CocE/NonD family hydrolase [Gemmatimonadaceae bacterium]|nr:CocE/NonD family hydrolase [Gemmatimonadaceae bacterium]
MLRHPRFRLAIDLALGVTLLSAPMSSGAQQSGDGPRPEWVGTWRGTLVAGPTTVRLALTVRRDSTGTLIGLMKSETGAQAPVVIDAHRDTLRFTVAAEHISYVGVAGAAGDSLRGTFTQGAASFPLGFGHSMAAAEALRPQDPEAPLPYRASDVSIPSVSGVQLAGTVIVPQGRGPFPAVVFVTGSGPQDRDEAIMGHRPFLVIADYLARHGIASLRYDDRGYAKSTGVFEGATTADFANDAEAAVRFMRSVPGVASDRVGIIGHSEGGVIGPMVAARTRDVAFLVLMAATGVPGDSIGMLQMRQLAGRSEQQVALARPLFRAVAESSDSADAVARLAAAMQKTLSSVPDSQRATVGPQLARTSAALVAPWMRYFVRYDPRGALGRVHVPVLALDGSLDLQVSPRENLAAIDTALRRAGNRDFRTVELPGLNHLFQSASSGAVTEYARIEETISPQALELIASWINSRFALR